MTNYIFKRFLLGIISLLSLIIIVFFLINLLGRLPIEKTDYENIEEYDAAIEKFGFNETIWVRFSKYFKGIFQGNFGDIYKKTDASSVTDLFFSPLQHTIIITSISFFLSTLIGVTLGFIAGYNSGNFLDNLIGFIVIFFMAIPSFILAALALILGPYLGIPTSYLDKDIFGKIKWLQSLLLPIIVMTLGSIAGFTYYTRNEIKSILSSDYILNAKSKGLSGLTIFRKYVFRNSLIPIITIVIPSFVVILGGSLVIETFFNVPGSSSIIIDAIKSNETNVVMFYVLFFGAISIFLRIFIDVLYVFIDPRIQYSAASSNKLKLVNRFKTFWFDPKKPVAKVVLVNGKNIKNKSKNKLTPRQMAKQEKLNIVNKKLEEVKKAKEMAKQEKIKKLEEAKKAKEMAKQEKLNIVNKKLEEDKKVKEMAKQEKLNIVNKKLEEDKKAKEMAKQEKLNIVNKKLEEDKKVKIDTKNKEEEKTGKGGK